MFACQAPRSREPVGLTRAVRADTRTVGSAIDFKHPERGKAIATATPLAVQCRDYAARCVIVAQPQASAGDKLALIATAQAWVALADAAEKNEAAPGLRGSSFLQPAFRALRK